MHTPIPPHLMPETAQAPWGLVPDLGLTVAGTASMDELLTLQDLMADHGLTLQPTRMLYDRLYALERLSTAHARGDARLQAVAQDLFDAYQRRGEWIGLVH
ncbi:hypothetical protein SAMN05428960_1146 [Mitsuaria sp. PDC51]|uniref:hypothetical protein n=1 Tax=unclassified Roseateles TaxID=2626991 RepID=UPI0008E46F37|nr:MULTISPECIES: hypothetical protein [unclassified Roseateles]MBB3280456.1 hypothetical protein [Mitsuaria sp. BK037]MBB3292497.1 hypothetical protein [Mitsuaria sp. BK041]MBB3361714.1 hypothetical protein [Mitsuaria sp. BK045]SFR75512.1 hypothetical protein SAMN05428960_1146 [Mitsuaria sp. PDC51]